MYEGNIVFNQVFPPNMENYNPTWKDLIAYTISYLMEPTSSGN